MLTALVLICSATSTPNLADCGAENARVSLRLPTKFANPIACLMQSQAFLAQTSLPKEFSDDDLVKIVCVRTEPVASLK
jgi:hypothetical protein